MRKKWTTIAIPESVNEDLEKGLKSWNQENEKHNQKITNTSKFARYIFQFSGITNEKDVSDIIQYTRLPTTKTVTTIEENEEENQDQDSQADRPILNRFRKMNK